LPRGSARSSAPPRGPTGVRRWCDVLDRERQGPRRFPADMRG
jgi:hypothetical protein